MVFLLNLACLHVMFFLKNLDISLEFLNFLLKWSWGSSWNSFWKSLRILYHLSYNSIKNIPENLLDYFLSFFPEYRLIFFWNSHKTFSKFSWSFLRIFFFFKLPWDFFYNKLEHSYVTPCNTLETHKIF